MSVRSCHFQEEEEGHSDGDDHGNDYGDDDDDARQSLYAVYRDMQGELSHTL